MTKRVAYGEGRELLIRATVSVVAEKGLRGLTFRAVAEHAGVNNSLVARHFGTRESLLVAALDWATERTIENTHLLDLSSERVFADALISSLSSESELQAFQYEMALEARRNPVFREPVSRLYQRYNDVVSESLRQFGIVEDVENVAREVFASMDGLVLQHVAGVVSGRNLRNGLHQVWSTLEQAKAKQHGIASASP
ncbi:TetR/AcrR family transcriptional regulator [Okibacterium endophyticum]